jgi:hypothetical protein
MFNMRDPKAHGERWRLFSQGFSKSTILNRKSQSKPEFVLQLLRSNEMFLPVRRHTEMMDTDANDVVCELFFGQDFEALA